MCTSYYTHLLLASFDLKKPLEIIVFAVKVFLDKGPQTKTAIVGMVGEVYLGLGIGLGLVAE